jgi:glycine hydroxymethyltransferase
VEFKRYAAQVVSNSKQLANSLLEHGFDLVSGGTDNHLILIDLRSKGVTGKSLARALDQAGIVTNYNTVPNDPRKPFDPSGLRIGTAAITSRGLGTDQMPQIVEWIDEVVEHVKAGNESGPSRIAREVREMLMAYPAPGLER